MINIVKSLAKEPARKPTRCASVSAARGSVEGGVYVAEWVVYVQGRRKQ